MSRSVFGKHDVDEGGQVVDDQVRPHSVMWLVHLDPENFKVDLALR